VTYNIIATICKNFGTLIHDSRDPRIMAGKLKIVEVFQTSLGLELSSSTYCIRVPRFFPWKKNILGLDPGQLPSPWEQGGEEEGYNYTQC
jgi:hypothetical protein